MTLRRNLNIKILYNFIHIIELFDIIDSNLSSNYRL